MNYENVFVLSFIELWTEYRISDGDVDVYRRHTEHDCTTANRRRRETILYVSFHEKVKRVCSVKRFETH